MWWKTCVNKMQSDSQTFFPTAFIYYGPVKLQRPFQTFVANNILEPRFCLEIVYSFPEILVNWFCKYSKALAVCLMLNRKYSDSCFSLCYLFSFWSWCLTKETFHQVWAVNSFFTKSISQTSQNAEHISTYRALTWLWPPFAAKLCLFWGLKIELEYKFW